MRIDEWLGKRGRERPLGGEDVGSHCWLQPVWENRRLPREDGLVGKVGSSCATLAIWPWWHVRCASCRPERVVQFTEQSRPLRAPVPAFERCPDGPDGFTGRRRGDHCACSVGAGGPGAAGDIKSVAGGVEVNVGLPERRAARRFAYNGGWLTHAARGTRFMGWARSS